MRILAAFLSVAFLCHPGSDALALVFQQCVMPSIFLVVLRKMAVCYLSNALPPNALSCHSGCIKSPRRFFCPLQHSQGWMHRRSVSHWSPSCTDSPIIFRNICRCSYLLQLSQASLIRNIPILFLQYRSVRDIYSLDKCNLSL